MWVAGASALLFAINTADVRRVRRGRVLVRADQGRSRSSAFIGGRPRARHGHRAVAGDRAPQSDRRPRRVSAERLARRLAGADARHHELHGHRRDRRHRRRSRASRDVDPARDAHDGAAPRSSSTCSPIDGDADDDARGRRSAKAAAASPGSPFVRAFAAVGIPYAAGAMNLVVISAALSSANSNLYMTARMLLSLGAIGLRAALAGRGEPTPACRCAPSPAASAGRSAGDSAGHLRAGERVSRPLRHRGRRHAVHLDCRSCSPISGSGRRCHAEPARARCRSGCRPIARAAWFGIVSLVAIVGHDVLRGRSAVQRRVLPAVSRVDVDRVRSHAQPSHA